MLVDFTSSAPQCDGVGIQLIFWVEHWKKKISSLQIKTINSLNDRNYDQNYCANANT